MKRIFGVPIVLVFLSCAIVNAALATVPDTLTYQGKLSDSSGSPVNGMVDISFGIYSTSSGGTDLWNETQSSVNVADGVFTVTLGSVTPIPNSVFSDPDLWLGIKVGTDDEMTPRQKLHSAPFAIKAGTADSVNTPTLGSLTCVSGEVPKWNGTSWACSADSGITSESDPTVNTLSKAALNCTTDQIIKWDGSVWVCTDYITAMQSKVDILQEKIDALFSATTITITTADSVGGWYASLAIGTDGYPVISHFTNGSFDLRVLKCGNAACSTSNTITTVDSVGNVGAYTSIAIGTDGYPVISYSDNINSDLKVLKCGNAACSASNTITTVDSVDSVGQYTSLAIGTDGYPVISHFDNTNKDLKVLKCGNAACSASNTITTVDSIGDVGRYTSLAIGTDGYPVISYHDNTNLDLKVLKCGNAACSASNTITTAVSAEDVIEWTSLAIGTDAYPVISYHDNTNLDLKVLKCGNAACSASNTITTVDSVGDVGRYNSLAIGTDGYPVISYFDNTNDDLKVLKCDNVDCSASNTATTADHGNVSSEASFLAIGTDGYPVISYSVNTTDLSVLKCDNQWCL